MDVRCIIIILLVDEEKRIREVKELAQGHTTGIWSQSRPQAYVLSPTNEQMTEFAQDL